MNDLSLEKILEIKKLMDAAHDPTYMMTIRNQRAVKYLTKKGTPMAKKKSKPKKPAKPGY